MGVHRLFNCAKSAKVMREVREGYFNHCNVLTFPEFLDERMVCLVASVIRQIFEKTTCSSHTIEESGYAFTLYTLLALTATWGVK